MIYDYENLKTHERARLMTENEKFKTVTLELSNRKYVTMTTATFKKDWRKVDGKN